MIDKKYGYLLWCWGSTIFVGAIIIGIALTANLNSADTGEEVVKVAFRMLLYAMLFILLYRAIIASLRSSVTRLAKWRNKPEAEEDAEFVLIIETLAIIVTILSTTIFAATEEFLQLYTEGRQADIKDVLVSVMAILLTALISYTIPAVGELEFAVKRKLDKELKRPSKSKKSSKKK